MDGPVGRLIGRDAELRALGEALDAMGDGGFGLMGVVGDPGTGKTRLLGELARVAERRRVATVWGRASEFERDTPLGVMVDALDDRVGARAHTLFEDLGLASARLLAAVFPSLSDVVPDGSGVGLDLTGFARYRMFRAVGQLLEELSGRSGLVVILDDVHWADETSIEFLDHLVRHPPCGPILVAVSYRPVQAPPQLVTVIGAAAARGDGHMVSMRPFGLAEVREFLGPDVGRARSQALYLASGGNPFYLEALARMGPGPAGHLTAQGGEQDAATGESVAYRREDGVPIPHGGGGGELELPHSVRAALQVELAGLSRMGRLVAQAAAVAAESFEPRLAAVAAEVPEDAALEAFNEMAARDIVRIAEGSGRFRFRHSLVRSALYASAAPGWRLAAHARIAAHLAELGAPATVRAHHVEQSARIGDRLAVATLIEAARAVAAHAPATAAHWLRAALRLIPEDMDAAAHRPKLTLELARLQAVSGQVVAGRDTARMALRSLPPADHIWRPRAAWVASMMERLLGRPDEARALVVHELDRIVDPHSPEVVSLRVRLAAECLFRGDQRAAGEALAPIGDLPRTEDRGLAVAVAAMRVLPAYSTGRHTDAVGHLETAGRLLATALDEQLAEWMDPVAFLCWMEMMLGRCDSARRSSTRALQIARSTGQSYAVSNLLAAQAGAFIGLGRLTEATIAAEDSVEVARPVGSRMQVVIATSQQCLAAGWSGQADTALRLGADAVHEAGEVGEWWGRLALYARAVALINAGQPNEGAAALLEATDRFKTRLLDPFTVVGCCEMVAQVEAERDRPQEALACADRAERFAHPDLEANTGLARLARAHALYGSEPDTAAEYAQEAIRLLDHAGLRISAARARQRASSAYTKVGDRRRALDELRTATEIFAECGARGLYAQALREQRRLGVRVPWTPSGQEPGPFGLSRREMEVAQLVAESHTNRQIAEKLYLSVRTVETHITHIFAKLGVTSRTGIVKALHRQ